MNHVIQLTPEEMQLGVDLQAEQTEVVSIFYYLNFPNDTLGWISIVMVPSLVHKGIFLWLFQPSQAHVILQKCVTVTVKIF